MGKKIDLKYATTIGSLPAVDVINAFDLLIKYTPSLIAWPQLPKRSFFENMYVQFSENFPGINVDENSKQIIYDSEKGQESLEKFYTNYLDGNIEYFKISPDYAMGYYQLLSYIKDNKVESVKCQITGPVTFGLSVKDRKSKQVFYDEQIREVIVKHLIMKSIWQIENIIKNSNELKKIILFIDEPYLASYGSAFSAVGREDIVTTLRNFIDELRQKYQKISKAELYIGIHCCANTDWSLLLGRNENTPDIDILSFDAYDYFENLILYIKDLKYFIENGGVLSWGIVPSSEKIEKETTSTILEKLEKYIEILSDKGVKKDKLLNNIMITPSCGMGSLNLVLTEKILKIVSDIFNSIN